MDPVKTVHEACRMIAQEYGDHLPPDTLPSWLPPSLREELEESPLTQRARDGALWLRELILPPITVDSRERQPYQFIQPTTTAPLPVGDYQVGATVVERKGGDEYLTMVTGDRTRFERQLERLQEHCHSSPHATALVLVEAHLGDLARRCIPRVVRSPVGPVICPAPSGLHVNGLLGSTVAWIQRYYPVKWHWAKHREAARQHLVAHLYHYWRIESVGLIPQL